MYQPGDTVYNYAVDQVRIRQESERELAYIQTLLRRLMTQILVDPTAVRYSKAFEACRDYLEAVDED